MYSVSFMWEHGNYDDEFHRLNSALGVVANSLSGFLGAESWQSSDGSKANAVYYWDSLEALKEFSSHPTHLEAKKQYDRWYRGYHVVVSQVLRSYGDDGFTHITPNARSL